MRKTGLEGQEKARTFVRELIDQILTGRGALEVTPSPSLILNGDAEVKAELDYRVGSDEFYRVLLRLSGQTPGPEDNVANTSLLSPSKSKDYDELRALEALWFFRGWAENVESLKSWLNRYPTSENLPAALLFLGVFYYHGKKWVQAESAWSKLIEDFPEHQLSQRALVNKIDQRSWPLPSLPELAKAHHPLPGERLVFDPFLETRESNHKRVTNDSRYTLMTSGLPLIRLAPGEFLMGGSQARFERELPVRRVTLTKGFRISAWPVTRGLWRRFRPQDLAPFRDDLTDLVPVNFTTYELAEEFCDFLSGVDGVSYRLPTEAEWEYACRGGLSATTFPWGNEMGSREQYNYYHAEGMPVGSFPPNGFGLFDTVGNNSEWTADIFAEDAYARTGIEVSDPCLVFDSPFRVVRGFFPAVEFCRELCTCSTRVAKQVAGFRLVTS